MSNAVLERLRQESAARKSLLCVGLDVQTEKLPLSLRNQPDGLLKFIQEIISATADLAIAYKVNTAFYECMGLKGWMLLEQTASMLPSHALKIADCKRGDIGHTGGFYAKAFYEQLPFDAVTLHPYMGSDSIKPFLDYPDKLAFILAVTSNAGAVDFELQPMADGRPLWQHVMAISERFWQDGSIGYVAGATRPELLAEVREFAPTAPLLVPGVGAQGGSVAEVISAGYAGPGSLLINASRSILFASEGDDFAEKAREAALAMLAEMTEAF
jgi:orotidine-5'-phosphate decarboxylase